MLPSLFNWDDALAESTFVQPPPQTAQHIDVYKTSQAKATPPIPFEVKEEAEHVSRRTDLEEIIDAVQASDETCPGVIAKIIGEYAFSPSVILESGFSELEEWSSTSISNWKLLYRASRDGFSPKAFHKKCDQNGATVCFFRVRRNYMLYNPTFPRIGGGFTKIAWRSPRLGGGRWITDEEMFLFSATDEGPEQKVRRLPILGGTDYDVFHSTDCGPRFSGFALRIWHSNSTKKCASSYDWTKDVFMDWEEAQFRLDELEVFSVE